MRGRGEGEAEGGGEGENGRGREGRERGLRATGRHVTLRLRAASPVSSSAPWRQNSDSSFSAPRDPIPCWVIRATSPEMRLSLAEAFSLSCLYWKLPWISRSGRSAVGEVDWVFGLRTLCVIDRHAATCGSDVRRVGRTLRM